MAMACTRLLLQFSLLLGLLLASEWTSAASPQLLQSYLETAVSEGIIDQQQSMKLHQLALSMNLKLSIGSDDKKLTPESQDTGDTGDTITNTSDTAEQERANIFMRVYNHLTLLNVLYLSGAVVVMGAYTIFMTMALEKCSHAALAGIMAVQVALVGGAGINLWYTVHYAYVGGLLCTLSTSMVPFTVYHAQRALDLWPKRDPGNFVGFNQWIRPGWVVMEIAAIVVGVAYLYLVRFPFLLFPISFSLWYLSMDLTPLWPGFDKLPYRDSERLRAHVSIVMGLLMMLLGYASETISGSDPDLGFWLYFFGLLTFYVAANFIHWSSDVYGSLFLLISLSFVLIGSRLDRITFQVFGTLGVIGYVVSICTLRIKPSSSLWLWLLKGCVAVALFSQAVRSGSAIAVLGGLVCVVAFNFSFVNYLTSSELYALVLLVTNLGFVAIAGLFNRPLDLWLFTLPDFEVGFVLVTSLTVLVYHARLYAEHVRNNLNGFFSHFYLLYKLLVSVGVSFVLTFLRQPGFAWVGAVGMLLVALSCHSHSTKTTPYAAPRNLVSISVTLLCVVFSLFLQSNWLYLVSCLFLLVFTLMMLGEQKLLGCLCAVFLVLVSIPLNSKFLIIIGAIYVILYLAHLAHVTFKDSLLFPLVLIALGLGMIGVAVQYQQFEAVIHETFYSLLPKSLQSLSSVTIYTLLEEGGPLDWSLYLSMARLSWESFTLTPLVWVFWPGALTFALVQGPPTYLTYMCAAASSMVVAMALWTSVREYMKKPLDMDVKVDDIKVTPSMDPEHEGHGMVISIKGTKPLPLAAPPYIALDVAAQSYFWDAASRAYPAFTVSMARSLFLPYKLTPHLVTLTGFTEGSTSFSAKVLLGTGHRGSHKMKHSTAIGALRKLLPHVSTLPCVVLYAETWYQPWSKLFVKAIDLDATLKQLLDAKSKPAGSQKDEVTEGRKGELEGDKQGQSQQRKKKKKRSRQMSE